jgi:hypothetical protein
MPNSSSQTRVNSKRPKVGQISTTIDTPYAASVNVG